MHGYSTNKRSYSHRFTTQNAWYLHGLTVLRAPPTRYISSGVRSTRHYSFSFPSSIFHFRFDPGGFFALGLVRSSLAQTSPIANTYITNVIQTPISSSPRTQPASFVSHSHSIIPTNQPNQSFLPCASQPSSHSPSRFRHLPHLPLYGVKPPLSTPPPPSTSPPSTSHASKSSKGSRTRALRLRPRSPKLQRL
jgi:hypothetical protein